MAVTRPTTFPTWTDGAANKVSQPPSASATQGFTAGQSPPFQWVNWLFYTSNQWLQWLDQSTYTTNQASSVDPDIRLLGGGNWTFNATSRVLAWDAAFQLSIPGQLDAQNQAAAGNVTLNAGQVAYVTANIPITAHGDVVAGSTTVNNVDYPTGITVGMTVRGANIPTTTVTAVSGNTITLAAVATTTGLQTTLVFSSSGALTVQASNVETLVIGPNVILLARATSNQVIVGVNSGQFLVKDGESKLLLDAGFLSTMQAPAGVTIAARTPVYLAPTADTGRTVGSVYPVDSGATNGLIRSSFLGFVAVATTSGATATIVTDGVLTGFTGLTVGATYYSDNTTPGNITTVRPTATNAYVVPVGVALSATSLDVNPAQSASVTNVISVVAWPNYLASTEAQLAASIASANTGGGGIIVIANPFTISANYTIGAGTVLQGRAGASLITALTGGSITMAGGSRARDLAMTTALTSGNMMVVTGQGSVLRDLTFTIPTTSTGACLQVTGNSHRIYNCAFNGVLGSSTATGINYSSGANNIDDSSIYSA